MGGQARHVALDNAKAELKGPWSYSHAVESWPEKRSSNQANHERQQHYQQDGGGKGPHSSTPFELDSQEESLSMFAFPIMAALHRQGLAEPLITTTA